MQPLVLDASALIEILIRSPRASTVEAALDGRELVAPDLVNQEVLSAVRRLWLRKRIDELAARRAVTGLMRAPVRRVLTAALIERTWSLRERVTAYDAAYVALAQRLSCPLVTCDRALSQAPRLGIEVIAV